MPMGRGFNLWEPFELWKQLKKIAPMFRRVPPQGPAAGDGSERGPPGHDDPPREYRSDQQNRARRTPDKLKS